MVGKDPIIYTGILTISLVLVFFVTVPFHTQFIGIYTLDMVEILLAIFLAFMIFIFDFFSKQRDKRRKDERMQKSHNMLRRILTIQRDLLLGLQLDPAQRGRIAFSEQDVDWNDFVRMVFPLNNQEILQIQNSFSDVISEDLIQDILAFTTHTTFLFSLENAPTPQGIQSIIEAINELIEQINEISPPSEN